MVCLLYPNTHHWLFRHRHNGLDVFSVYPFFFLGAVVLFAIAYLAFLGYRRVRTREWQHYRYSFRFYAVVVGFTVLFWATINVFTGIRREQVFRASYQSYRVNGDPQRVAYRFHYLDYPDCSETVYLDELRRYLESSKPSDVRLTLETTWDFGTMRGYSLEKVDEIRVNAGWSNGHPPWDALRRGVNRSR